MCFVFIIWQALPSVIHWGLWKEGNARIFQGRELMAAIYKLLLDWVSIRADFDELEWYSVSSEDL